jgi:hypothetical protein
LDSHTRLYFLITPEILEILVLKVSLVMLLSRQEVTRYFNAFTLTEDNIPVEDNNKSNISSEEEEAEESVTKEAQDEEAMLQKDAVTPPLQQPTTALQ